MIRYSQYDKFKYPDVYSYMELPKGSFFCDLRFTGGYFGIKLSEFRYYSLEDKRVYGFAEGKANTSEDKAYIICNAEVWNRDYFI